jgi:hypothetical protein
LGGFDFCRGKRKSIFGLTEPYLHTSQFDDLSAFKEHFGFVGAIYQNAVGRFEIFNKVLTALSVHAGVSPRHRAVDDGKICLWNSPNGNVVV